MVITFISLGTAATVVGIAGALYHLHSSIDATLNFLILGVVGILSTLVGAIFSEE